LMADRRRAFLGLGSNLGDRRAALRQAVASLGSDGDLERCSPLYETDPVGGPEDQGPYLNMVVELATTDDPRQLLARCRALEEAAHRVRTVRFGPRTLDADVLLVGDLTVDEPDLIVPHPRMWERRFVLQPLSDLAPDLVSTEQLIASGGRVTRLGML
jgi:2-amino-4-hydroxy-6-hydroxymethyldihydropteridine diphosphokinase